MRADLHPSQSLASAFIEGVARAVAEIASVFLLLGDLIAPRTHTMKKTDRSEPPNLRSGLQAA